MIQEINTHKINPANDQIKVLCLDGQGSGGAHHFYAVLIPHSGKDPIAKIEDGEDYPDCIRQEVFLPSAAGPVATSVLLHSGKWSREKELENTFKNPEKVVVYHYADGTIQVHCYNQEKYGGLGPVFGGGSGSFVLGFQNGPIKEEGVNGVTQEALTAIVQHRLECFQNGPYACHDNQMALDRLHEAKHWLFKRTLDRMQRGVEGTHKK